MVSNKQLPLYIAPNKIHTGEYWSLKEKFLNQYSNISNVNLLDPKAEFRYFCYRYIDKIRLFKLASIEKQRPLEVVIIEYRKFPHIEFLLRNAIKKLGETWCYTIVCGLENYKFMVDLAMTIHQNINVILTPYTNLDQSTYSLMLASANFWSKLNGSKILIMQEDSIIFNDNISEFLEWDYIGAPWPKHQNDTTNLVGNGGFSLRSKQTMLDVLSLISIEDTKVNSSTASYMKSTNNTIVPEDVYFAKNIEDYKLGKIAPWDIAFKFSSETQYNPHSFGGHNFWLSNKEWKQLLFKQVLNIVD
jgi:hypothetical protein